jgi:ABC-2 type transport system permease protein
MPAPSSLSAEGSAGESGAAAPRLVSQQDESRAFWRMRWRMGSTVLRQTVVQARLRLTMIAILSGGLWFGLYWLFADGFYFLRTSIPTPDLYDRTVQVVFGMFFAALKVMLIFSSGIILYSSLFRGRDMPLLLTLPARAERIFLVKFQEAVLMSSWAFVLLGSPMLLAYGIVSRSPWYYYAMLLPFLVAFVYIPAAAGAILCLVIVHRLPSGRKLVVVLAGTAVVAAFSQLIWFLTSAPESNLLTPGWFQEMLNRMSITEHRLLPSWWLSSGLLEAAGRRSTEAFSDSLLFLVLLISNALFFRQLAIAVAGRLFRPAYVWLQARQPMRHRAKLAWIDRGVELLTPFCRREVQLLIVKDFRLFRRDPIQWSQFLIFSGLLVLYFINVRRFSYDSYYVSWVNVVSFLNVSVVGLLLSTFTTRFIFPMISLEGRRFWTLGLLPVRRKTILWSKFLFAVGGSLVPCSVLILLSDLMLGVATEIVLSHQLTCVVLCTGLSGIAVGLGARMPSSREQSPSRIAAGFGGTLNLVLSTMYIVVVVMLTAVPMHFYVATHYSHSIEYFANRPGWETWLWFSILAGTAASLVLGVAATVVPMVIGLRAFRDAEF